MKFKTFFQRRSNSSMAESDSMGGGGATTAKRKKKEATTASSKMLTMSMKSGTGGGAASSTKSSSSSASAFITNPRQAQEKCASCSAAHQNGGSQPQPDESAENYNCENCGGREIRRASGIIGDGVNCNAVAADVKMTENSQPEKKADAMELEKAKQEVEGYKEMLLKAHNKIKELTDEVEKMKLQSVQRNKEFGELHDDFLLCMRSAERFRIEAEKKAFLLEREVVKLRQEVSHFSESHGESERSVRSNGGETTCDSSENCVEPLPAAPASLVPEVTPQSSDCEAVGEKKLALLEDPLFSDDNDDLNQCADAMNASFGKPREEKLAVLRKNCRGSLRNGLLNWCQNRTKDYQNVEITNFSTSWSNGLALAALVHSLKPDSFEFSSLDPSCPVDNFKTALKAAEKLGVKKRFNAVKILVESENPPWEPLVAYVTEIYLAVSN